MRKSGKQDPYGTKGPHVDRELLDFQATHIFDEGTLLVFTF